EPFLCRAAASRYGGCGAILPGSLLFASGPSKDSKEVGQFESKLSFGWLLQKSVLCLTGHAERGGTICAGGHLPRVSRALKEFVAVGPRCRAFWVSLRMRASRGQKATFGATGRLLQVATFRQLLSTQTADELCEARDQRELSLSH